MSRRYGKIPSANWALHQANQSGPFMQDIRGKSLEEAFSAAVRVVGVGVVQIHIFRSMQFNTFQFRSGLSGLSSHFLRARLKSLKRYLIDVWYRIQELTLQELTLDGEDVTEIEQLSMVIARMWRTIQKKKKSPRISNSL